MSPYGFDIRQISDSIGATLSLSADMYRENARLQASYWQRQNLDMSTCIFPQVNEIPNPSYNFYLNPELAFMQTMYKMQQNPAMFSPGYCLGGYTGGYVGGMQYPFPWMQPAKQETEDEKKKREAKEQDAKSKEALAATKLKTSFDKIQKLAEDKDNKINLSKSIIDDAKAAMGKETGKERLEAMQKVMKAVIDKIGIKAVYAQDDIKKELIAAGFNYDKYAYKDKDTQTEIWRSSAQLEKLKEDIEKKDGTVFGSLASYLDADKSNAKDKILPIISTWNDQYHGDTERCILRYIAENIPVQTKIKTYADNITTFTQALLDKANDVIKEGNYPKLVSVRDAVDTKLKKIVAYSEAKTKNANEDVDTAQFAADIKSLAADFEKLYARLRMMEAVKVNKNIMAKYKEFNDVKPGLINDNTVVNETKEDLEAENIKNYPDVSDLGVIKQDEEITLEEKERINNLGEITQDNIQTLIDEGQLTKIEGKENVYISKCLYKDTATGKPITEEKAQELGKGKYTVYESRKFKMVDGKLHELQKSGKTADGKIKYTTSKDTITSSDVTNYNDELAKIQEMLDKDKIELVDNVGGISLNESVFKSKEKNSKGEYEFFVIRDNQLVRIKNCKNLRNIGRTIHASGTGKTLDKLEADDFEAVGIDDVKSKKELEEAKKAEIKKKAENDKKQADEEIESVTDEIFNTVPTQRDINKFNEKAKNKKNITLSKAGAVKGWYKDNKGRYYKYNDVTKHLEYLPYVKEVRNDGTYITKKGKRVSCRQSGTPEEIARDLYDADDNSLAAYRAMNTFLTYSEPEDIISFLEEYEKYRSFFSNKLAKRIKYNCFSDKNVKYQGDTMSYGDYYTKKIIDKLYSVLEDLDTGLSDNERERLNQIRNSKTNSNIQYNIQYYIEKIITLYRDEHPKEITENELAELGIQQ